MGSEDSFLSVDSADAGRSSIEANFESCTSFVFCPAVDSVIFGFSAWLVYRWPQEALLSPSSGLGGTSGTDSVCGGNGFCRLEGNGTDELCMKCSSCASLSICGSLSYGCLRQCATGFQDDDDDGAVASYSLASCALLAQIGAVPTFCGRKRRFFASRFRRAASAFCRSCDKVDPTLAMPSVVC